MKLLNTENELRDLAQIIERSLHVKLFCFESSTPKWNAQRNLEGRTHYVDDDTLRFHKSRVLHSGQFAWGLLFGITCSDSLDFNNTQRGFRCAVFDVWGTCIYRPKLEESFSSSKAAQKALDKIELDVLAHYRAEIAGKIEWAKRDLAALETVAATVANIGQAQAA